MAETTLFTIGADATCSDGICGELRCVVVDPVARVVTHLVIQPKHRLELDRLVPLDLVAEETGGKVQLKCTRAEFDKLEAAEETEFLPGDKPYGDYAMGQVLYFPYYSLGFGPIGLGDPSMENVSRRVTFESLPLGEVGVHRGEQVHATDGDIGKVQGLVIERTNRRVTHVLLQEGHLWGRKEVAIPISAVIGVDAGIRLKLSKAEVQDLPPVEVDQLVGS